MWSPQHYRQLVRASAWYDLIVTAAFATPWTFVLLHGALAGIAARFGIPGELGEFGALPVLMANLMGSIVCVWALLRIRDPQPRFGRYDAAGRALFALWQAYALSQGASLVLLPFLLAEIAWGVAQALPLHGART
jgi:hypothetical protein